jgi:hypothetical protein
MFPWFHESRRETLQYGFQIGYYFSLPCTFRRVSLYIFIDSESLGFWTLSIVRNSKYQTIICRKHNLLPSSGERREIPTLLSLLESANQNHLQSRRLCPHLREDSDSVSIKLCFLVFTIPEDDKMILSVLHHRQNYSGSIGCYWFSPPLTPLPGLDMAAQQRSSVQLIQHRQMATLERHSRAFAVSVTRARCEGMK